MDDKVITSRSVHGETVGMECGSNRENGMRLDAYINGARCTWKSVMAKPLYVYHIITTTDIERDIQSLQPYPLVHCKNETCKINCIHEWDRGTQEEDGEIRGDQGERGEQPTDSGGGTGDGLGSDSSEKLPKLCAGPDGIIESEDPSGIRIRWNNGRTRRYSYGGGSGDRVLDDDGRVGKISPVGTYFTGTQGELKKLYEGPYKLIAYHTNTRRPHWHVIYYSFNKQWGFNSRLGRTIRRGTYKNKSVDCLTCLREYLYSGNGRQIVQDILRPEHIRTCECAEHHCGMDGPSKWKVTSYEADCTEGGNSIYGPEGESFEKGFEGMVDATLQADVGEEGESGYPIPSKTRKILGEQQNCAGAVNRADCENGNRNADVIILLCENGAFTEAEAMGMFAKSAEGINFVCSKQYAEKIRTYLHLARVLVFSESIKQRFERAKAKFAKENTELMDETRQDETMQKFKEILLMNGINLKSFFFNTFHHFTRQSNKMNNLFFLGPPSTGKTMIMNSLVECHFNFCRLTGLISNSSFNFSGLLHTNACLMDECKLTDNQFEQWKLLASGLPMSTDVKYKDRCDVRDVVLYTCSNYPIEMYCNVPMAQEAVKSRTLIYELKTRCPWYLKISPHIWEKCWNEHGLVI